MKQELTIPGNWDVIDSEAIADLTSSTGLTAAKAEAADACLISIFAGAANIRMDGEAATAVTGMPVAANGSELVNIKTLNNVKIIEQDSGTPATGFVHYLKHRGSN